MSMQQAAPHGRVAVGVDNHKYVHVAVAIDDLGADLGSQSFVADSGGYAQLTGWAAGFCGKLPLGIGETGSCGADGTVEMIRQVKAAGDVAVRAGLSEMMSLQQVIVNALTIYARSRSPCR